MRLLERMRLARERRRIERQVLLGLHQRGLMVLAVCEYGRYVRIYIDGVLGPYPLSPRTAALHLRAIEDREFERALAR